ncbi:hypothetical protein Tco_1379596 [Tanacetum coccineum]
MKFEKAEKERDDLKLTLEKFGNSSKNLSKLLEIQVSDKFKTGVGFDSQVVDSHVFDGQENERYKTSEGYHVVPPPYTGNFMPPKYDLVLVDEGEYVFSESITSILDAVTREVKTSVSKPKSVGEPLIEDWISDNEDENETEFKSKQRKPKFAKTEFDKSNEHVKTAKESVKKVEKKKQAKYPRKNSQSPRGYNNPRIFIKYKTYFSIITIVRGNFSLYYISCIVNISVCHVTYKTSEGYHVVPPPYTGNFMPPKYDLVLVDEGEYVFSESITSIPDVVTREVKTSVSKPKSVGEPLIEDSISDNEDENKTEFKSK